MTYLLPSRCSEKPAPDQSCRNVVSSRSDRRTRVTINRSGSLLKTSFGVSSQPKLSGWWMVMGIIIGQILSSVSRLTEARKRSRGLHKPRTIFDVGGEFLAQDQSRPMQATLYGGGACMRQLRDLCDGKPIN